MYTLTGIITLNDKQLNRAILSRVNIYHVNYHVLTGRSGALELA